jgi:hypothetical protein
MGNNVTEGKSPLKQVNEIGVVDASYSFQEVARFKLGSMHRLPNLLVMRMGPLV